MAAFHVLAPPPIELILKQHCAADPRSGCLVGQGIPVEIQNVVKRRSDFHHYFESRAVLDATVNDQDEPVRQVAAIGL
jgi:hypothetical protein